MRLEGLALLALSVVFGGVLPAHPVGVLASAFVLFAASIFLRRRTKTPVANATLALALVLLLVQGFRGQTAMKTHAEGRARLVARLPRPSRCDGWGTVVTSPTLAGAYRVDVEAAYLSCDDAPAPFAARVRLYFEANAPTIVRGTRVAFIAQLAVPEGYANDAVEHPGLALAVREIGLSGSGLHVHALEARPSLAGLVDRARNHVRMRIQATFSRDTEALARALMLGETDLDPEESERFRTSGLAHLLAVSGVHLAMAVGASVRGLRRLFALVPAWTARIDVARLAAAFGIPLAWLYADFAGGSGSAQRAAIMLSASCTATAVGRRMNAQRALAWSAILASLYDPLAILDVSFSLSLAATVGLTVGARPLSLVFQRFLRWNAASTSLGATVAATIACLPILAGVGSAVPIAGIPLNVVAVPVGELAALPLCLLHGILAPFPWLEGLVARLAGGALRLVDAMAAFGSLLRGFEIPPPTPFENAVLVVGLAVLVLAWGVAKYRARVGALAGLLILLGEGAERLPPRALRVTYLDVGQGDSAVIETPHGEVIVIDGGGLVGSPTDIGKRVLRPHLRARRIREVALLVLSHPHPDHFGGLASGTNGVQVREAWDSGLGRKEGVQGGYQALLVQLERNQARMPSQASLCGQHVLDGVTLEVLAPCPSFSEARSANDNSIVIRITYGSRRFLFVGDAELEEEEDLLRTHRRALRADVLKVGHHGSRTSTSASFLAAVEPSIGVISSGVRNRFGHPYTATLETLQRANVTVLRTDQRGSVTIETDGSSLDVRTAR